MKRLKDEIKSVAVLRARDLRDVMLNGKPQTTPTVFVFLGGGGAAYRENTNTSVITLNFVLLIAERDVSDVRSGGGARDAAGPLASQVIEVMQGWRPGDGFGYLELTAIDAPLLDAGYFYLPLVFTTNTFVSGDNHHYG